MRFFGFRSKPDWQHTDATRRASAVASGTSADLLAALPDIARRDADPRVRLAAIARLDAEVLLRDLRTTERDPDVAEAIDRRLVDLALVDPTGPDEAAVRWLATQPTAARTRLAREARASAWRRAALDALDKPALVAERCVADPDPGLRLELIERIGDADTLERIAKKARRDDKRLARAASERAQALRIAAGDPEALRAAALAIGEGLAALRREPAAVLADGLEASIAQWAALAPRVDAATAGIVEGHIAQARAALERARGGTPGKPEAAEGDATQSAEPTARVAASATTASADDAAGIAGLERLVEHFERRLDDVDHESLDGLVAGFEEAWRALAGHGPAAHGVRARFEAIVDRARRRIAEARSAAASARRERERSYRDHLSALEAALDESSIALARAAGERLDAARSALDEIPRELRRREATARQRLATLLARQRWSLNRQRAELGDAAAALLGQGLHPDAVAARVRELREAWERLDAVARAAGDEPDPDAGLARRFRALTAKALAPTRRYFAERQRLRSSRAAEFEALAAGTDPPPTDDRALALARRAVASALRRLDEVEPSRRGELGRRLREALARLDAARAERADVAEQARRRLLAQLRRRLAHAELGTALAAARETEAEWARLPRARPEVERGLRAELDALVSPWFERERASRAEAAAARDAAKSDAEAIVAELEALAARADASPSELEHRMSALKRRWQVLASTPRNARGPAARGARSSGSADGARREPPSPLPGRRYEAALAAAEATRAAAMARAEAEERARRAAPIAALRALEAEATAHAAGRSRAERPPMPASLGDDAALPAALRARRDAALAVIEGRVDPNAWLARVEDARRAARELALRAECCAGIDSPADDASDRRRVQVARLEARMRGGGPPDALAEIAAIEAAWAALGPLDDRTVVEIGERIARAAAALRAGDG